MLCRLHVTYHGSARIIQVEIHTYMLAVPFVTDGAVCSFPHRRSSVCMTNACLKHEVGEIACRSRIFGCAVRDYFSIFHRCLL